MSSITKILPTLIVLVLLIATVVGLYFGIDWLVSWLVGLDRVACLTIVAVITVLTSARILASGPRRAKQQEAEDQLRVRKADIYRRLVEAWAAVHYQAAPNSSERARAEVLAAENLLLVWGGAKVIQEYTALVQSDAHDEAEASKLLTNVLLAIRKDLGLANTGLSQDNLLAVLYGSRQQDA